MPKCIIIGGGLSGLSSAVNLSKHGIKIRLLEASPKLGGRAYSFNSNIENTVVDNGQHVMMGCYKYTLDYLKSIGTLDSLLIQKHLEVNYVGKGGRQYNLEAFGPLYPLNLVVGILKFKAIHFSDRLKILLFFQTILFSNSKNYEDKSVYELLLSKKQSKTTIKIFWELLVVSIMNTGSQTASAKLFVETMRDIFLGGNKGSSIIIPKSGLSELFCDKAEEFLVKNESVINKSERVSELRFNGKKITHVITNKNIYSDFDYIISAVPFVALLKFYPLNSLDSYLKYFIASPIVTIHLWLKRKLFKKDFYGLIESKIHWLFVHEKHISIVVSNAVDLVNMDKVDIIRLTLNELGLFFPSFKEENIAASKIIKEKKATFPPSKNLEKYRSKIKSDFSNLIFAGDWTNTGLPSTIESAAKSGKVASLKILDKLKNNSA